MHEGWVGSSPAHGGVPLPLGKSGLFGCFITYVVLAPNRRLGIFVAASRVSFAMFEGIRIRPKSRSRAGSSGLQAMFAKEGLLQPVLLLHCTDRHFL